MQNKKPEIISLKESYAIFKKYLKPHQKVIIVLVGLSLVSAAADAFVPFLAGRVFDAIIAIAAGPQTALQSVLAIIAMWFLLRIITDITDWRINVSNDRLATLIHSEYMAQSFAQLLLMPISFHKSRKQGSLGERLHRAADFMNSIIENVIINLAPRFLSIVVALVIVFFINATLALFLLGAVIFYAWLLVRVVPQLVPLQRRMYAAYSRAYGNTYDALGNILEVKQAATEAYEKKKMYTWFVLRAARFWAEIHSIWQRLDFYQRFLVSATQLVIFLVSVVFIQRGLITPGELVMFNGYAAMLFGPFVVLGRNWQTIQNGLIAISQAEKILSYPPEIYVPENAVILADLNGKIEFHNVSFTYRKRQEVLQDITFSIEPGETIALVGESGVGKTTIVDLILGLYFPQDGRILIDGHNIRTLDLTSYRKHIGVVPQEVTLFNDTVQVNIKYGNFEKSDDEMKKAAEKAHATEFIEKLPQKYDQRVGWRGIKLSSGQKQRVAIARAILRDPKILILDEPTSALDARSEKFIQESLNELMKGRTTIIIAHRLSTVRRADKIIVLDKGRIAEIGKHDELIRRPGEVYRKLYELQFSATR